MKQERDSLKRSRSRLNAYKALASPAYMALSSPDPITTTFELRQEMKRVAQVEKEFRVWFSRITKVPLRTHSKLTMLWVDQEVCTAISLYALISSLHHWLCTLGLCVVNMHPCTNGGEFLTIFTFRIRFLSERKVIHLVIILEQIHFYWRIMFINYLYCAHFRFNK